MRAMIGTFLTALAVSTSALACSFHGFVVQPTLVDRLLPSSEIILARPDPDDRFRFVPVEVLAGRPESIDIPVLVDSMTRRRLMARPGDAVLFSRNGAFETWQRRIFVQKDRRPLIDAIIARLPAWRAGDDNDRALLFAPYIDDPDPTIQALALRELDKLPYVRLRRLDLTPDVDALLARIDILSENHLLAIRTLLLGLSPDPSAGAYVEAGFRSRSRTGSAALGAFATAVIERRGLAAVLDMTEILRNHDRPSEARGQIVEALAIHAESAPKNVRDAIDAAIAGSIDAAPELAGAIARHFGDRTNWTYAGALSDLLMRGELRSSEDFNLVSKYLASFRQRGSRLPDF